MLACYKFEYMLEMMIVSRAQGLDGEQGAYNHSQMKTIAQTKCHWNTSSN